MDPQLHVLLHRDATSVLVHTYKHCGPQIHCWALINSHSLPLSYLGIDHLCASIHTSCCCVCSLHTLTYCLKYPLLGDCIVQCVIYTTSSFQIIAFVIVVLKWIKDNLSLCLNVNCNVRVSQSLPTCHCA